MNEIAAWELSALGDAYGSWAATTGEIATPGLFAVTTCIANPADLNDDGTVDLADLLIVLSSWGPCDDPGRCAADLNDDGVVDLSDLLIVLSSWGPV